MTQELQDLIWDFQTQCSYIVVDESVIVDFYNNFHSTDIDLLRDYILSQGLAEEVVY